MNSQNGCLVLQVSTAQQHAQEQKRQWEDLIDREKSSCGVLKGHLQAARKNVSQLKGLLQAETTKLGTCERALQMQKQVSCLYLQTACMLAYFQWELKVDKTSYYACMLQDCTMDFA